MSPQNELKTKWSNPRNEPRSNPDRTPIEHTQLAYFPALGRRSQAKEARPGSNFFLCSQRPFFSLHPVDNKQVMPHPSPLERTRNKHPPSPPSLPTLQPSPPASSASEPDSARSSHCQIAPTKTELGDPHAGRAPHDSNLPHIWPSPPHLRSIRTLGGGSAVSRGRLNPDSFKRIWRKLPACRVRALVRNAD